MGKHFFFFAFSCKFQSFQGGWKSLKSWLMFRYCQISFPKRPFCTEKVDYFHCMDMYQKARDLLGGTAGCCIKELVSDPGSDFLCGNSHILFKLIFPRDH